MVLNTLGAVPIFDGENPRTYTGRARTVISGGNLVVVSGAANVVGSSADTFATTDIIVDIIQGANYANGIALNNAGSNTLVTVATQGAYLVRAATLLSGGVAVAPFSGTTGAVQAASTSISFSGTIIGRTIIPSISGTDSYALVDFHF